jgi:hypothetical protein
MNPGQGERSASVQRAQSRRHDLAGRCKDDRSVQFVRRLVHRAADPHRAQFMGQRPMLFLERTNIHRTTPRTRNLNRDMRARAEPIEAEALARLDTAEPQGAIPDDAGTQQRCRFLVREPRRQRICVTSRHDRIVRIAAVDLVAGEGRAQAQILPAAQTKLASAAGRLQPGNADPIAFLQIAHIPAQPLDDADHLMPGDNVRRDMGQLAFDDMKVRPAHAAHMDTDPDLARTRFRRSDLLKNQRTGRDRRRMR